MVVKEENPDLYFYYCLVHTEFRSHVLGKIKVANK